MKDTAPTTRQRVLRELKFRGAASQAALADALGLTREAVRQQLAGLEAQALVSSEAQPSPGRGRPTRVYRLTEAAEEQFPKFYDSLTVTLVQALGDRLGDEGLRDVLTQVTDRQVAQWEPVLAGKSLRERMEALRGVYFDADPFTEVREDAEGTMLIEHNCPYLAAARDEPRLCSVTVSTMKRLLGVEVERTERFQLGDGRCVFRVRQDREPPEGFRFDWEPGDRE